MAQFVYFAALLVFCGTGNSLETATSPQQQHIGDNKDKGTKLNINCFFKYQILIHQLNKSCEDLVRI